MAVQAAVSRLVARSTAMREVHRQIELVRDSPVSVLLTGERGTGKELVARTIHQSGRRARAPFAHVDCAGAPADVLAETLFGGERPGRFEQAGAGTIYLEAIDALDRSLQERVLNVLARNAVERGGGRTVAPVHARLIASTCEDLRNLVRTGSFRQDLFSRLSLFPIALPPLRDRRDDIPALAQAFLQCYQAERTPPVCAIEERAVLALKDYSWPGNVRELEVAILGAVLACGEDRVIRLETLPSAVRAQATTMPDRNNHTAHVPPMHDGDAGSIVPLAELERRAIAHALRVTGGNVTRAARALGIGRATMYRKLDRFKLAAE